ncbi:MAG: iron-sulfur cluster assembly scaffold protein [Nanoarchaeota archaeon]|nr:iron-sulfur cluster assembly scaffold protein [Nanoarchaeota archaeon]
MKLEIEKQKKKEWFYSEKVKEHFFNPHNIIRCKEDIAKMQPNGHGKVGSPACGDVMEMWIKVKNGKIKECKWQTFGCASAIASTSILSDMVIGMTLEEAYKIRPAEIVKELGGLPKRKIHCSVLGDQALRAAINDYNQNS